MMYKSVVHFSIALQYIKHFKILDAILKYLNSGKLITIRVKGNEFLSFKQYASLVYPNFFYRTKHLTFKVTLKQLFFSLC